MKERKKIHPLLPSPSSSPSPPHIITKNSYLSAYVHTHSPSPSISSPIFRSRELPSSANRKKREGIESDRVSPSQNSHIRIIADLHHVLNTFKTLQTYSVQLSLGMKDRIKESHEIFAQCLLTYDKVVQENDSLKKEQMEYQGTLS
jgi:hypothetical protein